MFGYIRPYENELKLWQIQAYKACYCGLCRALGSCGFPCRLLLRYDFNFLSLVRATQSGMQFTKGRCPLRPFVKREMLQSCEAAYAAKLHILLSCAKWRDDWQDKEFFSALPLLFFLGKEKKARQAYPTLAKELDEMLKKQGALEKENCRDADQIAEPFSKFMGSLFSFGFTGDQKESLTYLGYMVGKFIVWADALNDFEKDKKRGQYNVFALLYPTFERAKEEVSPLLYACAQGALSALQLLNDSYYTGIAENILNEGLLSVIASLGEKKKRPLPFPTKLS